VTYTPAPVHTTRPTLTGTFGMAASTHWLATATAQSVLERGGNAFDAAAAAGFVLHVAEPHLNGPGGDMVAILATAASAPVVVSAQGPAPAAATVGHFRAEGLTSVPGSGGLAAAVPGAVEGWLRVLERYGTWELGDVLEYAIHQAETGCPVGPQLAGVLAAMAPHFREHWPTSAELWLREGRAPLAGETLANPVWAATLRRLVRDSGSGSREEVIERCRQIWKSGAVAEQACRFLETPHRHASGGDHAGVLRLADWAAYDVGFEAPETLDFRGVTVAKAGFWSSGPVLLQALSILDGAPDSRLDPSTADGAHVILEALKLAMADRDAYYGESHPPARLRHLLSADYATGRRALIEEKASLEQRPGLLPGATPFRPPLTAAAPTGPAANGGIGEPTVTREGVTRGDTCHVDVVDRWGNMISATPSGGWLQSSPAVPGLGFCLGTRLQMTWLDPSSPSALVPGNRPRTTLSPTMLVRDGRAVTALGTPGGDQQDQWQLLYLLRTLVGDYEPQQAIDAPAFHTGALVSSFWPRVFRAGEVVAEARLGADVLTGLDALGHDVTVVDDWSLGRLSSVSRDPSTGWLSAAANPRGHQGYAAGR
jgi:gamma-glutamyltranspeptidase/glutathione hydrolase